MAPSSFDNIINKFKTTTKQAADQMARAAKVTRLKMDILAQKNEKNRLLQSMGEKAFQLLDAEQNFDGKILGLRVENEFNLIKRIDDKIKQLENEITNLQTQSQTVDVVSEPQSEQNSKTDNSTQG